MNNEPPVPTLRQMEILQYMIDFYRLEDRIPSTREISKYFKFSSQTGAVSHLHALAKKGIIEHRFSLQRERGWWRFNKDNLAKLGIQL